jgi:flagellar assembly protein FliH
MASVRIVKAGDAASLAIGPLPTSSSPSAVSPREREVVDRAREQEIAAKVQEARSAGFIDGEQKGRAAAKTMVEGQINTLTETVARLGELKPKLRQEAEGELIQLSLAIARRVLQRELSVDPDALKGIVSAAVQKIQGQQLTTIRLHPGLHTAMAHAAAGNVFLRDSEVVPDATLPWGAVLFDSTHGVLDMSIDSQLDEISRGLADRLQRSS